MLKQFFQRTFEQNKTDSVPSHIQKLVSSTSKEFVKRHKTNDPTLQRKIVELAHVNLHMRIYQRYGAQSDETMSSAYADLTRRIVSGRA